MADTIKVKASPTCGDRVALWDVDEAHPGGEAFVAGAAEVKHAELPWVEVAETPAVLAALRDGLLVKSGGGSQQAERRTEEPAKRV